MTPEPNANDAKATVPLSNAAPQAEAETVPLAGDARATVPLPGSAPDASTRTALPEKIGRFEVRAFLGSGAFGDVYRAYDPQLDREVALKVAKPGTLDTPERVGRFLREAKSAANLRHPNIVPLYETGRDGDRLFIASAFIAGRTLEAVIQEANDTGTPIALEVAARIVRKLADALAYAHAQGIVHRDVKPANVIVDDKGEPLLLDFGLAARAEAGAEKLTQDGQGMGTPAYMAPEQAEGTGIAASDQYSLGCALYELLTGQTPFAGGPAQQMFLHKTQPVPSVRKSRREVPRDLETVLAKCVEKEPSARYASCAALAEDLRRYLDGEPVQARRVGPLERAARWAKRNPAVAGLLAVVGVITVGLMVSLFRQYEQAVENANTEREKKENAERAQQNAEKASAALVAKAEAEKRAALVAAQAAQAGDLVDLLTGLFRSSDPLVEFFGEGATTFGLGAPTKEQAATLRPVLPKVVATIRARLSDPDPAVAVIRARLLSNVGNNMRTLAMYPEARAALAEALELRRKHLPESDPEVWQSELALAQCDGERGEVLESLERLRTFRGARARGVVPTELALTALTFEGLALSILGHPDATTALLEAAVERERYPGVERKDAILARVAVIAHLLDVGGSTVQIVTHTAALKSHLDQCPNERIRATFDLILGFQAKVAARNSFLGPAAAAEGVKRDLMQLERVLPENNTILAICRFELSKLQKAAGAAQTAEESLARVLADVRKNDILAHPKSLSLLDELVEQLVSEKKIARARDLIMEFEKANVDRFGPDNPWLVGILTLRAGIDYLEGKHQTGEVALRRILALVRVGKFFPNDAVLHGLRKVLQLAAIHSSALVYEIFSAARASVEKSQGLGAAALAQLQFAEARSRYEAGNEQALVLLAQARETAQDRAKVNPTRRGEIHLVGAGIEIGRGRFREALADIDALNVSIRDIPAFADINRQELEEESWKAHLGLLHFADAVTHARAARRLALQLKQPVDDLAGWDMQIALCLQANGQQAEYNELLVQMFKRYGMSTDLDVLTPLAWAAGAAPSATNWNPLSFESKFIATFEPQTKFAWGQRALALVRLRAGKLNEAEAALTLAPAAASPLDPLVRGLVAVARGDRKKASGQLERAETLIREATTTKTNAFPYRDHPWYAYTATYLLHAELKAALAPPVAPAPRPKQP